MKKFLSISIFLLASLVAKVHAGDIVSPLKGQPESLYDVTHSTVAISSNTVSTDAAVPGYRAVYIYNLSPATTIFYFLGTPASTTTVNTIGWPIFPWRTPTAAGPIPEKIEYNGLISYRLAGGAVSTMDVTKKTIRK